MSDRFFMQFITRIFALLSLLFFVLMLSMPLSAFAASDHIFMSAGDGDGAINDVQECVEVTNDTSAQSKAVKFDRSYRLNDVVIQLSVVAGGATTVTHHWAYDAAGDHPATPSATTDLVFGNTTATDASATEIFDDRKAVYNLDITTKGSLWLCLKLPAGGSATLDYIAVNWSQLR